MERSPYAVVRKAAVVDLIDVARQAATRLRDRGADAQELALASALEGAAAEIASDISEPALA